MSSDVALLASLKQHTQYLNPKQQEDVVSAYHFAHAAHEGQYRRSGDPYITHPLSVANILADMYLDTESIMAGLLHDVMEDCGVSKQEISEKFSPVVADLVDGVSKMSAIEFASHAVAQAENFQKMMLAMTKDMRVILVKLADRLHNMRTLQVLSHEKRRRIATETLEIYAPIANRLGINNFRVEFEDLGFAALYPMRSERIKKAVLNARGNRKEIISSIHEALSTRLEKEAFDVQVTGREKHLYSIYRKMRMQRKSFSQIMDVYGFRIVVKDVDTCYRVLGAVHNLYKPIPGRFKDYIAIPKSNGYQSLHTTLKGYTGVPVEIQIRTEEMESMANHGIAAHWLYKSDMSADETQSRARSWIKSLLELQKNTGDSLEFIENVKIDLFPDEVYLFTPRGHILALPYGATPIDFAYAVHTDVGNRCVAAKVDNQLCPLSAVLESGQTAEILTGPTPCPSPAWLNFAITAKARSSIRHYLKHQERDSSIQLGERLMMKALAMYDYSLSQIPEPRLLEISQSLGYEKTEDLFVNLGLGNQVPALVAHRLLSQDMVVSEAQGQTPLVIRGTEGMVIQFAKCCCPIPDDPVVGFISSGRGIIVHRETCRNIANDLKNSPEKYFPANWEAEVGGEFSAMLRMQIENKRGMLARTATVIADYGVNIESIEMHENDANLSVIQVVIKIKDRVHLASLIKKLRASGALGKIVRLNG